MIELEPFRGVRRGEREWRIVPSQDGQPVARAAHGRGEGRHIVWYGAAHASRVVARCSGASSASPAPASARVATVLQDDEELAPRCRATRETGAHLRRIVRSPSIRGSSSGKRNPGRPERESNVEGDDDRQDELSIGPREDRSGRVVGEPRGHRPPHTDDVVVGAVGQE